jgi:cytochrome b involved in lipid metabolism
MTVDQIKEEAYDKNLKLAVLDNTVLVFSHHDELHPGGKFVLHKNIGRDISKYFYGGYKLVNDPSEKQWTHSASASLLANSLQVANIQGQSHVKPVAVKLEAKTKVNSISCN